MITFNFTFCYFDICNHFVMHLLKDPVTPVLSDNIVINVLHKRLDIHSH